MTRYKDYFKKMLDENANLFKEFQIVHDKYTNNQKKYQDDLNRVGEKVRDVIKEYESRVCANTERGMYSSYSGNLAEKFQNEVRKVYPMIDFIGIKNDRINETKIKRNVFQIKKLL